MSVHNRRFWLKLSILGSSAYAALLSASGAFLEACDAGEAADTVTVGPQTKGAGGSGGSGGVNVGEGGSGGGAGDGGSGGVAEGGAAGAGGYGGGGGG